MEKLMRATIQAGLTTKTFSKRSFEKVIVDTTVQPKAVQFPTNARLYRKIHGAMLRIAEKEGLTLHQSYRKLIGWGFRKHGGYAKAKQSKRARIALRTLKTMAGRVVRDVERKLSAEGREIHGEMLARAKWLLAQERTTKGKLYSLHAPKVECIAMGKAHRPNEFGVKTSLATTHKEGFCVGIQTCRGNLYDGHTLAAQLHQVEKLTWKVPAQTFVDMGYKGHGVAPERSQVLISGTRRLSPKP